MSGAVAVQESIGLAEAGRGLPARPLLRLLWIATKPPAPPVDGGRLVSLLTLQALAREGVEVTVVAPVPPGADTAAIEAALARFCRPRLVPATPGRPFGSTARSLLHRLPVSIVRHSLPGLAAEVERLVAAERFDAVHAEQLQAFAQAAPALRAGLPVVLRAQNVESDLWRSTAALRPWARPALLWESRRLARHEGAVVARAAATVALTERDASRLRELGGPGARVAAVAPPFPSQLPQGEAALAGDPPLVLLGSGGWLPNRDGNRWFLEEVWPHGRSPGAVLHYFAAAGERPERLPEGVEAHTPPADSRDAFAPGSVLVVPLRIGSGIRVRILEAWARGVPVIATPEAVAGLEPTDRRELLLVRDARSLADALAFLRGAPGPVAELAARGRERVAAGYEPAAVARRLIGVYRRQRTAVSPRR